LHYARALDALAHLPPTENNRRSKVDTLIKQVSVSMNSDSPEQNMARMSEAERLVQELPGPDGAPGSDQFRMARVRYWIGHFHFLSSALPEAMRYLSQVLAVGQKLGDIELLAATYRCMGTLLVYQGHYGKAEPLLRQAITLLEQLVDWTLWIPSVSMHGITLGATGRYEKGLAECQRALARARELNSLFEIGYSTLCLSLIYALAGDLACTRETSRQAIEALEQSGDRFNVYRCYAVRAYAEVFAGRFEAAAESMAKCQAVAQEFGGQLAGADLHASTFAEIALGKGQVEQAISLAEQSIAMARKMGGISGEARAREEWGRSLAAISPPRWDEAEAQMAESLRLFELGEARLYAARMQMHWGIICRDRGNTDAAREHFEKAAAQWAASNIPWELERVNKLLAELPKA
jgi:tetratricopeptide (TPR) repeat protein